ncbi:MAG: hypothetical protein FJ042_01465 [Candidatus Cloacimonetes bacterium]|nr:hypothetical protein [Candidatus Cloacimonadota bacterium]
MGTQQILLIVLSVIIVGVAIAVGITMFRTQAYNANQTAIASEVQQYAAEVIKFYKTPVSQGGSGQGEVDPTQTNVSTFIGFNPTTFLNNSENGVFKVTTVTDSTVIIAGIGKELKGGVYPKITTTIILASGTITSVPGTSAQPGF